MIGVTECGRRKKKPLQELLALEQGGFAQVESIAKKKVEYEIDDRRAYDKFFARRANVHALLEEFEVAVALFVQGHKLSVNDCFARSDIFGK